MNCYLSVIRILSFHDSSKTELYGKVKWDTMIHQLVCVLCKVTPEHACSCTSFGLRFLNWPFAMLKVKVTSNVHLTFEQTVSLVQL